MDKTHHHDLDKTSPWATVVACAICLSLLWGSVFYETQNLEETALRQTARDATNLAVAFREHVHKTVSAVDQLMVTFIATQRETGDWDTIPAWFRNAPLLRGLALQVSIASPEGKVRASTTDFQGDVDVSDRPHIQHHFDPSARQPFVSVPIIGRVSGRQSIQITRRMTDTDGTFRGIIVVSADPEYFTSFFDQVEVGKQGVVTLTGLDGIVRARRTGTGTKVGQNLKNSALFEALSKASSGSYRVLSQLDGIDRIFGFQTVPDFPLLVSVGFSTNEVRADALRQKRSYLIGASILSAIIIVVAGAWFLYHQAERRRRWTLAIRAEEELREQKMLLDAALENMAQGVVMFDASDKIVFYNSRYIEMYGLSPDVVRRGASLKSLIRLRSENGSLVGGDPNETVNTIRAAIASGKTTARAQYTSDGRTIHVVIQPMASGGWVTTHEDISERRLLEIERDRNRELVELVMHNVPSAIFLKEAYGERRYVLVNRTAEQYLGWPPDSVVGKRVRDVFPTPLAEVIDEKDRRLIESGERMSHDEHTVELAGKGQRTHSTTRRVIVDKQGKPRYLLVFVNDVTEHRRLTEQLQQSQKMEAVGELTGGLAHDFNNLLMIMVGNLEVLGETCTDPDQLQLVESILQASLRGSDLTKQLLAFSRRQRLQPRQIDINEQLTHTTNLLRRTLGHNVNIDLRLGDDMGPVLVDPAQFEAAVVNIAINARDAMPDGGTLRIATSSCVIDDRAAEQLAIGPGNYCTVKIADTGCGMPPDLVARIFEPFFTTKAPGKGTGLGLSMVYGFMKQSQGTVTVNSEVGNGTTFELLLPRCMPADAPMVASPPTQPEPPRGEHMHVILAVDDDPAVRATAVGHLKSLGYQVIEADDGKTALEKLDEVEIIDLLFTDIVMPGGMNGMQLAQAARAKRPGLKVLYTSGFTGHDPGDAAADKMDAPLLEKPYRRQALADAVVAAMTERGAVA